MKILKYYRGFKDDIKEFQDPEKNQDKLLDFFIMNLIGHDIHKYSRLYYTNNYNNTYTFKFVDKLNKCVEIFIIEY